MTARYWSKICLFIRAELNGEKKINWMDEFDFFWPPCALAALTGYACFRWLKCFITLGPQLFHYCRVCWGMYSSLPSPMKRSPCCKHRFCVELTAVVATSLQFTALCAIISPLSQSLSSSVFTFESNQPPIIMIMGLDPCPRSTFLLFYCCCSVLHCRSSEHFQKPSTSDLPEVSIEIPWCIEMIYHYSENISLDLPHHCSLLSDCEEKCFFSNATGQLSSSKETFVAI